MKLIANLVLISSALFLAEAATEEPDHSFLYHDTQICAKHKSHLCLSLDTKNEMIVLDSRRKLRFEIETVERINMQLNRLYTLTGPEKTKTCFVKKPLNEGGVFGVNLAPCDENDSELVLAVELPDMDTSKLSHDEFVLKEVSYANKEVSSPLCFSTSADDDEVAMTKKDIRRKAAVILSECGKDDTVYGQEFKAKNFKRSQSQRLLVPKQIPEVKAEVGRFCLTEQPDLCLGVSLENGTTLDNNRLVQFKNLTKNELKELYGLKMRWFHSLKENKIATAANLDFCLEALYNAPIGDNRRGTPQFDDVVHLGTCDQSIVDKDLALAMRDLPKSELFYVVDVEGWKEIRTDVPQVLLQEGGPTYKCVSIVRCVKHDNDHCVPYNSFPIYDDVSLLQQGAHARLKDCDSRNMVSQRFGYTAEKEITFPPTKAPTMPPTLSPVAPTPKPTTTEAPEATATPTPRPTFFVEPITPTEPDENEGSADPVDEGGRRTGNVTGSGLFIALALVGFLCLLIILLAVAYYYKNREEIAGAAAGAGAVPEEDENFIARV